MTPDPLVLRAGPVRVICRCRGLDPECPLCRGYGAYNVGADPLRAPGTDDVPPTEVRPGRLGRRVFGCGWMVAAATALLLLIASPPIRPGTSELPLVSPRPVISLVPGAPADIVRPPPDGSATAGAPRSLPGWATVDEGQGPGHAAAGPALRRLLGGDPAFRGRIVTVSKGGISIRVRLTDWCACGDRHGKDTIIDLDETDFRRLTGRAPGIAWVRVSVGDRASPTLPPTDP